MGKLTTVDTIRDTNAEDGDCLQRERAAKYQHPSVSAHRSFDLGHSVLPNLPSDEPDPLARDSACPCHRGSRPRRLHDSHVLRQLAEHGGQRYQHHARTDSRDYQRIHTGSDHRCGSANRLIRDAVDLD